MAPKAGFTGNRRAIREMLRTDGGVGAALDAVADGVSQRTHSTSTRSYATDRQVRSVAVDPEDQAVNGHATKALGDMGLTPS